MKKYKSKVRCLTCGSSMVYYSQSVHKLICSNYHKGLIERCRERNTVSENELDEILEGHQVSFEDLETIYIDKEKHYKLVTKSNHIGWWDGNTLVI